MNGHQCGKCKEGWVCEAHPEKPWPHGLSWPNWLRCGGAGMPCPGWRKEADMALWGQELGWDKSAAEMVARHVKLEPTGKLLKGNCPFCNDHNTLIVSREPDSWHCFGGCGGVGGDGDAFYARMTFMRYVQMRTKDLLGAA